MAHIEFLDETMRDGQQSLWGLRMRAGMAELFRWFEEDKLKPTVHRVYPLEGFREAMAEVLGRQAIGRVVVAFE